MMFQSTRSIKGLGLDALGASKPLQIKNLRPSFIPGYSACRVTRLERRTRSFVAVPRYAGSCRSVQR